MISKPKTDLSELSLILKYLLCEGFDPSDPEVLVDIMTVSDEEYVIWLINFFEEHCEKSRKIRFEQRIEIENSKGSRFNRKLRHYFIPCNNFLAHCWLGEMFSLSKLVLSILDKRVEEDNSCLQEKNECIQNSLKELVDKWGGVSEENAEKIVNQVGIEAVKSCLEYSDSRGRNLLFYFAQNASLKIVRELLEGKKSEYTTADEGGLSLFLLSSECSPSFWFEKSKKKNIRREKKAYINESEEETEKEKSEKEGQKSNLQKKKETMEKLKFLMEKVPVQIILNDVCKLVSVHGNLSPIFFRILSCLEGFNLNGRDNKGQTIFHTLIAHSYRLTAPDFTSIISVEGVDLEAKNAEGVTLVSFAAHNKHFKLVETMVDELRKRGKTSIERDDNGDSIIASISCHLEKIRYNTFGVKSRDRFDHNRNVETQSEERVPLIDNLLGSVEGKCAMLEGNGTNPKTGDSLLMECMPAQNLPFFQKVFLFCPEMISHKNLDGKTVLHIACEMKWNEAILWLVDTKIDLFAKNKRGEMACEVLASHRFLSDGVYSVLLSKMSENKEFSSIGRSRRTKRSSRRSYKEDIEEDEPEEEQEEEKKTKKSRKK